MLRKAVRPLCFVSQPAVISFLLFNSSIFSTFIIFPCFSTLLCFNSNALGVDCVSYPAPGGARLSVPWRCTTIRPLEVPDYRPILIINFVSTQG